MRTFADPVPFAEVDADGDGRVTRSELSGGWIDAFEHADADLDAALNEREYRGYLHFQRAVRQNQDLVPEGTRVQRDLAYVADGHPRQALDLYLPAGDAVDGPRPLVVWIHGGGWRKGSKAMFGRQAALLNHGFAVASINYRLSQHARFPAQVHDGKAAVRYLRSNAERLGIDPDRIGLWGASAGGHLACLVGTGAGVEALESDAADDGVSSRVQAVCDWFGVTDFVQLDDPSYRPAIKEKDPAQQPIARLLGGVIGEHRDLAWTASPAAHVSPDDPPFLIMHGDRDDLVPLAQSTTFHERLQAAGVDSELHVLAGAKHAFFPGDEPLDRVADFFTRMLSR